MFFYNKTLSIVQCGKAIFLLVLGWLLSNFFLLLGEVLLILSSCSLPGFFVGILFISEFRSLSKDSFEVVLIDCWGHDLRNFFLLWRLLFLFHNVLEFLCILFLFFLFRKNNFRLWFLLLFLGLWFGPGGFLWLDLFLFLIWFLRFLTFLSCHHCESYFRWWGLLRFLSCWLSVSAWFLDISRSLNHCGIAVSKVKFLNLSWLWSLLLLTNYFDLWWVTGWKLRSWSWLGVLLTPLFVGLNLLELIIAILTRVLLLLKMLFLRNNRLFVLMMNEKWLSIRGNW